MPSVLPRAVLAELQGRRFVRVRPCCVAACVAATTLFGGESAAPSPPRPAAAISAVVAWLRALCLNQSGTPFHAVVACSWGSWLCVLFLSVRGCVIWVVCGVVFVFFYVGEGEAGNWGSWRGVPLSSE